MLPRASDEAGRAAVSCERRAWPNWHGRARTCYHRRMRKNYLLAPVAVLAVAALTACSPKYDWRDYVSPDAPYRVLFPGKPATYTRSVDLDGMKVDMTMTATEVDGAMYAVGAAQAPDAAQAQAALAAMKLALMRNIGATGANETSSAKAVTGPNGSVETTTSDVVANGAMNGVQMRLHGHFEARGNRFYQVVVIGPARSIEREPAEEFLSSFKPQ